MTEFFKDLFSYHHHYNQEVLGILMENETVLSERTIPLYSHIINAHQIWNARIMGGDSFGVNDVHSLTECAVHDQTNYLNSHQILESRSLEDHQTYFNSRGDQFENSIRDMLFQVVNHTTHHRGQIISDLRQSGIAPPITDYIWYKRK